MTITVFIVSLLGAMGLGMPIAFALLVCGVALMLQLGNFDTQILAQNLLEGTNNYPLMAVPFFMLAGGHKKPPGPPQPGIPEGPGARGPWRRRPRRPADHR